MKTQGFTLIELLAVIVILAIIALIATPIVLGIIDDAKESAQIRSSEMYLKGVANAVMKENLEQEGNFKPTECTITTEGNLDCDDKEGILEVEVDGEKPINGNITFEEGKIKEVRLEYANAIIVKNEEGNLVYSDEESDSGSEEEEILAPGLYDADGNMTMSWEKLLDTGLISVNDGNLTKNVSSMEEHEEMNELLTGKLIIDNSVTNIKDNTFESCVNLETIILPNSITNIGIEAFYCCFGLKSINIPGSVEGIGARAFSDCENLTSVIIEDGVSVISYKTFANCENLKDIEIPISITFIGECAFSCNSSRNINYKGTIEQWNNIELDEYWNYSCPQITVHCTDGDIVIPANT